MVGSRILSRETNTPDSVVWASFGEGFVIRPQEKTAQLRVLAQLPLVSLVDDSKAAGVPHYLVETRHGSSVGFLLSWIGRCHDLLIARCVVEELGFVRHHELLCEVEVGAFVSESLHKPLRRDGITLPEKVKVFRGNTPDVCRLRVRQWGWTAVVEAVTWRRRLGSWVDAPCCPARVRGEKGPHDRISGERLRYTAVVRYADS